MLRPPRGLSRSLTAAALVAVVGAAGPPARAHTTVQAPANEGVQADNAIRISHVCGEKAVIAQSVVFPTDAPEILVDPPGATLADLGEVIEGGSIGLFAAIQSRDIFEFQDVKEDALGNAVGFYGRRGQLRPGLRGRVPFQFTAPSFVETSCATRLVIEIAIADICSLRPPTIHPDKVNLWIPDNGSSFAAAAAAAGVDGVGAPARLTVHRNLASKPLPASCGAGYAVTVRPTAAQIDRDLPIGGYWRIR